MFFKVHTVMCALTFRTVSRGKACTVNRRGGKLNHLSIAYSLRNNCTKIYRNWTTIVTVIIEGVSALPGEAENQ